jgi:ubiquinone/menaquinone biosynthesis C-methylase UbiE
MADESMVRTLEAQARAIWPQEREIFRGYALPDDIAILDAGCGTGEVSVRLAELFRGARVLGVDVNDEHLERARRCFGGFAPRLTFRHQSVFELDAADGTFDLTVCRHVLHALPYPDRVINELVRVTRPGGRLHLLLEDYGMLHFRRDLPDPRDFWHEAPAAFGAATGTDLYTGRNAVALLRGRGLVGVVIEYIVVDTLRVPRDVFATIIEAWRDGYAEAIKAVTRFTLAEVLAYFDTMIANIRDVDGYAVWMVPIVSAKVMSGHRALSLQRKTA